MFSWRNKKNINIFFIEKIFYLELYMMYLYLLQSSSIPPNMSSSSAQVGKLDDICLHVPITKVGYSDVFGVFFGVFFFLIPPQKYMLWVLIRSPSLRHF